MDLVDSQISEQKLMEDKPVKSAALQATHSHLSSNLLSTSSTLGSAAAAAHAAEDMGQEKETKSIEQEEGNAEMGEGIQELEDVHFEEKNLTPLSLASSFNNDIKGKMVDWESPPGMENGEESDLERRASGRLTGDHDQICSVDAERGELLSSAASGSDKSLKTEPSEIESERGNWSAYDQDTFDLIEHVVQRMLNRAPHLKQQDGVQDTHLEDTEGLLENREVGSIPTSKDMQLLAKLVDQVHEMRRKSRQRDQMYMEPFLSKDHGNRRQGRGGRRDKRATRREVSRDDESTMTLEAAAEAARAAAVAAQAAASSVARNTEAVELLFRTLSLSLSSSISGSVEYGQVQRRKSKKHVDKSCGSDKENNQKAIMKQNKKTHWILGIMLITTIAWRFGVAKVVNSFRSKLTNPMDYIGGLFGGSDEPEVEETAEEEHKGNLLEQIKLPSILPGDDDKKKEEDPTQSKALDPQTEKKDEETVFNFGNILQIGPNRT